MHHNYFVFLQYEDKQAKEKYFNKGFPEFDSKEIILSDQDKKLQNANEKKELVLVNNYVLNFPILSWRSLGNYEKTYPSRSGPGEYGEPVYLTSKEKQKAKAVIKEFGFNLVASDKISLNRLPKDLRHPELVQFIILKFKMFKILMVFCVRFYLSFIIFLKITFGFIQKKLCFINFISQFFL